MKLKVNSYCRTYVIIFYLVHPTNLLHGYPRGQCYILHITVETCTVCIPQITSIYIELIQ